MDEKIPAAVRVEVGPSRERVAQWAGVSEPTVALYEASPKAVRSPTKRRALDVVYRILERALRELEGVRTRFGLRKAKAKEAHEATSTRDVPASGTRRRRTG
jgi:hypothetical protein